MRGNEGRGARASVVAARQAELADPSPVVAPMGHITDAPHTTYRCWCVQTRPGGGYALVEAIIPSIVVEQYAESSRAPDMRGIVAARISQRLETAAIPSTRAVRT